MSPRAASAVPDRLGPLAEQWRPPGAFDPVDGIWVVDPDVANSFPAEGLDRFRAVESTSFWFTHRNEVIADQMERYVPAGSVMVEVGSGSGVVSGALEHRGYRMIAVEPHAGGARAAGDRGVTLSCCGDLESLALPEKSVVAVGAFDVIEHIADAQPLLEETRRVLSPDGVALFTVPAYQWLWSEMGDWNGHHLRYDRPTLRGQLSAAGYEIVAATYLFSPLVAPAYGIRVLGERFRPTRSEKDVGQSVQEGLDPDSRLVKRTIERVLSVERRILRRFSTPFGTSLMAVARPSTQN